MAFEITTEDLVLAEENGWQLGDPCGIPGCGCHLTDEEIVALRSESCTIFSREFELKDEA